jgi:hypothetical protein
MTALNELIRAKNDYIKKFGKKPLFVLINRGTNNQMRKDYVSREGKVIFGMKVIVLSKIKEPLCCGKDRIVYKYP